VVLAHFIQQFIYIILRKKLPAPFLIIEGLTGDQREKPKRVRGNVVRYAV
jgi:hypothetical protein